MCRDELPKQLPQLSQRFAFQEGGAMRVTTA